jgi:isopenicillin N synthase-like dioxygenase
MPKRKLVEEECARRSLRNVKQMLEHTCEEIKKADERSSRLPCLPYADVPTIDITPFWDNEMISCQNGAKRLREYTVAETIKACRHVGFMNVSGHGVPPAVIDAMLAKTESFFSLTEEQKNESRITGDGARGYNSGGFAERLHSSAGLRQYFDIGSTRESWPFRNVYPRNDLVHGFKATAEEFYSQLARVREALLRLFSAVLIKVTGVDTPVEEVCDAIGQQQHGLLRLNYYPEIPSNPVTRNSGEIKETLVRCGAHTDWSPFTILLTESDGLEILQGVQWTLCTDTHTKACLSVYLSVRPSVLYIYTHIRTYAHTHTHMSAHNKIAMFGQCPPSIMAVLDQLWRKIPIVKHCFVVNIADQMHFWYVLGFESLFGDTYSECLFLNPGQTAVLKALFIGLA